MSELTKAEQNKKPSITQEDIDNLLDDVPDLDEPAEEPSSAQVILAENEEAEKDKTPPDSGPETDQTQKIPWSRSRLLWIGASIALILSSFMMLCLKPEEKNDYEAIPSTILRFPIVQTREEPIGQLAVSSNPLSVAMREFVVLAPSDDKDITLLFTDVVVNLSDITAAEKINKNTAFIRYIIYDTLEAALISGDKEKIVEACLAKALKEALNRALEKESVKEVVLDSFKVV